MFVYFRDFHDFFKIELEVSLKYVKNLQSPLVVFFEKKNGVSRKKKFSSRSSGSGSHRRRKNKSFFLTRWIFSKIR